MNVLRRDIFQIYLVNIRTVFHVEGHPGRRNDVIKFKRGIRGQFRYKMGFLREFLLGSRVLSPQIDLFDLLYDLKEPGTPRNSVGFQAGGDRETDRFIRPCRVRDHQICI